MNASPTNILLVEDDPNDGEMAVRAIRRHNVTNHIYMVGDGAEALDFIFCRGVYASRRKDDGPMLILLDLRLPKVAAWTCFGVSKKTRRPGSFR